MKGQALIERLDSFLDGVVAEKAAESSSTEGHVENQGDSGTSHPSKSVEDGTQDAAEGARSSENTSDVKSDVPGQPVDSAKENPEEGSEHPITAAKPTGEDPANETGSADPYIGGDAGKDTKGKDTSHPAKVDFGGKYASVKEAADALVAKVNSFNAKVAALAPPKPETKKADESKGADPKQAAESEGSEKASEEGGGKSAACEEGGSHSMSYPHKSGDKMKYPGEGKKDGDEDGEKSSAEKKSDDEAAGEKAAEVVASNLGVNTPAQDQDELIGHVVKEAFDDATRYAEFCKGLEKGAAEAEAANKKKSSSVETKKPTPVKKATTAKSSQATAKPTGQKKKAMEDDMAGADMLASGGEGEAPGETGEGAGSGGSEPGMGVGGGGDEIGQIIAALEAAGVSPEDLQNIDPELLAQAIAEFAGAGGGMGGEMGGEMTYPEGGEMMPAPGGEAAPEMAPAAV